MDRRGWNIVVVICTLAAVMSAVSLYQVATLRDRIQAMEQRLDTPRAIPAK